MAIRRLKLAVAESPEAPSKTAGDFILEKFWELIGLLGDLFSHLWRKADEILPPEKRAEALARWVHVGLTTVLPIFLLLLLLYCCCCRGLCTRCCCCCRGLCTRCCCCLRRSFAGRRMRAPGRPGRFMPRPVFEDDPKGYFINLRAKKDLLF